MFVARRGIGSISLADMTAMTGDTISAFVGPALGVNNARRIPLHPTDRMDRPIPPHSTMTLNTIERKLNRRSSPID